jgi:hypothetical protein
LAAARQARRTDPRARIGAGDPAGSGIQGQVCADRPGYDRVSRTGPPESKAGGSSLGCAEAASHRMDACIRPLGHGSGPGVRSCEPIEDLGSQRRGGAQHAYSEEEGTASSDPGDLRCGAHGRTPI